MNRNTEVDKYITAAADFAQPILNHLRNLVHQACPEVQEMIKWSFPCFEYKGQILCSFSAHKKHCNFGFWLGNEMPDPDNIIQQVGKTDMGNLGQLKSLDDLPKDEILIKYIHQAMKLSAEGRKKSTVKSETKESKAPKTLEVPDYLLQALEENPEAKATFEKFSNSNKKEYIEWLTDAKTETTRNKRLAEAVQWMSEGKVRNWKYIK
jgi:uncharacterized protein YdeI (YjbR/CyaY-like superfamily)